MIIATIVDWEALLDVVVASLAAGIGVTIAFSVAIMGLIRVSDMRRDGRVAEAWAYGGLAMIGLAISATAVVYGIVLLTSK